MKAVADTLAVARSNLIERVSRRAKSRRPVACRFFRTFDQATASVCGICG